MLGNIMIFCTVRAREAAFSSRLVYTSLFSETVFRNDTRDDGPRIAFAETVLTNDQSWP